MYFYFYSAGIQHGNLHQLSVTISRMTYLFYSAYFYSAGIQHGNLHQLSVTISRMSYLFCGHSTLEPASTVCNDEQGELFYSVGPRPSQEPVLATDDRKNPDEVLGKQMQVNRPAG